MPLYIDRHDLPDATAADVAAAHMRDLEVQDGFGVRFVTYWFEEGAGSGFCLVEGPDEEAVEAAHRAAHGLLPSNVIEVDQAAVRGFFGRLTTHPPGEPYTESAFRAILFTDMVDSTRLTQQLGDRAAMQFLRVHDSVVRAVLARFGGSEVKHTGDGIMAAFTLAFQAVAAAMQIQRALQERDEPAQGTCTCVSGWRPGSLSPSKTISLAQQCSRPRDCARGLSRIASSFPPGCRISVAARASGFPTAVPST